MRINGWEAIEYAKVNHLGLNVYESPVSEVSTGLTVQEAKEIAQEDAKLIHLDVPDTRFHVRVFSAEAVSIGGTDYNCSLGYLLYVSNAGTAARRMAALIGGNYEYGVAVVDTLVRWVDCGKDEDGNDWLETLDTCPVVR